MSNQPRLSILMPFLNAGATIEDALKGLLAQRWSSAWEIVAADNGSTDASVEIVRSYEGRLPLRCISAAARKGASYALNRAAEAAFGRSVVVYDADDVAADGWLSSIGDALEEHEWVASRHDPWALNPSGFSAIKRGESQNEGLQTTWYPPYIEHAGGCGMGVRRSLLLRVGGYAEGLQNLYDTELCFRLTAAGARLTYVRDAVMCVRYRTEAESLFRQAAGWARANTWLYRRYRPDHARLVGAWSAHVHRWRRLLQMTTVPGDAWSRLDLMWCLGWQWGLLRGALENHVEPVMHGCCAKLPDGGTISPPR